MVADLYRLTDQEANKKIAYRLKLMQEMFNECVMIADEYDIRLQYTLEVPEQFSGGHNTNVDVSWRASAQHC